MWGPGAPPFKGRTVDVTEALCYPRPLQERVPILLGGSGEQVTLRLVARYADACNLFGDPGTVRAKLAILHAHCAREGRDPAEIHVTHFAPALAASADEQVGRYRALAEAGVQTAIVGLHGADAVRAFAPVIEAFRPAP